MKQILPSAKQGALIVGSIYTTLLCLMFTWYFLAYKVL